MEAGALQRCPQRLVVACVVVFGVIESVASLIVCDICMPRAASTGAPVPTTFGVDQGRCIEASECVQSGPLDIHPAVAYRPLCTSASTRSL